MLPNIQISPPNYFDHLKYSCLGALHPCSNNNKHKWVFIPSVLQSRDQLNITWMHYPLSHWGSSGTYDSQILMVHLVVTSSFHTRVCLIHHRGTVSFWTAHQLSRLQILQPQARNWWWMKQNISQCHLLQILIAAANQLDNGSSAAAKCMMVLNGRLIFWYVTTACSRYCSHSLQQKLYTHTYTFRAWVLILWINFSKVPIMWNGITE